MLVQSLRIEIMIWIVYLHAVNQLLRKEKVQAHFFSSFVKQISEKKKKKDENHARLKHHMVVKLLKGISNTIQWGQRPRLTHYQLLKSKVSVREKLCHHNYKIK